MRPLNMRRAIFPGSFNPFTIGHADIVRRALLLFDEVVIAIGSNINKADAADVEARKATIEKVFADESRVRVYIYNELTVDFARRVDAAFIVRGVRNTADFEYEQQIAEANRRLSGIETVLLYTKPDLQHVSSTLVRDLQRYGKDVKNYLP